jgi:Spy/CpxP family protein refolding chaperone
MRLILPLILVLLVALTPPTHAQNGSWQMPLFQGEAFQPEFSARDLKVITRVLQLSPDAQGALQALYDGYAAQLKGEVEKLKAASYEEIDRAELMNNDEMLEPVRERVRQFKGTSERIRQQFLADLKSLLTREQEENWTTLERELRRMRALPRGQLAGETLDVVALAEDAVQGGTISPSLAEVLLRYRGEIDAALGARDSYLKGDGRDFFEIVKTDPGRATTQWKEALRFRLAVRDTNERFARLVIAELPEGARDAFEQRAFSMSYPMLNRPTRLDQYFEDALSLPDLTPEQKAQIEAVKRDRQQKVEAWSRKAAAGWRKFQEEEAPEPLARALGRPHQRENAVMFNGSWLPQDHPLIKARLERVEIERSIKQRIESVLTPEQAAAIPARLNELAKFEVWTSHGI